MTYAAWGTAFLITIYLLLPSLHATALACAYVAADSVQAIFVLITHFRNERQRAANFALDPECVV